jgi:hypothetical protein
MDIQGQTQVCPFFCAKVLPHLIAGPAKAAEKPCRLPSF